MRDLVNPTIYDKLRLVAAAGDFISYSDLASRFALLALGLLGGVVGGVIRLGEAPAIQAQSGG